MQNELDNRMEKPGEQSQEKPPGKKQRGRPKAKSKKPAKPREIKHEQGKIAIEVCPSCGADVKMEVYKVAEGRRYCRCPKCGQHHALTKETIRQI